MIMVSAVREFHWIHLLQNHMSMMVTTALRWCVDKWLQHFVRIVGNGLTEIGANTIKNVNRKEKEKIENCRKNDLHQLILLADLSRNRHNIHEACKIEKKGHYERNSGG